MGDNQGKSENFEISKTHSSAYLRACFKSKERDVAQR